MIKSVSKSTDHSFHSTIKIVKSNILIIQVYGSENWITSTRKLEVFQN